VMQRFGRIDLHAADRIGRHTDRHGAVVVMTGRAVVMRAMVMGAVVMRAVVMRVSGVIHDRTS
jgi:hypothetical protein